MTEDSDATDSFKFSDLRSRFEGAKNGTNPLKPTTSQETGNGGGGASSTRGNLPRPPSSNGSTNGARGGGGDGSRPPSRDGSTNGAERGGNGLRLVSSNGSTNGAAGGGGGRGNEPRPLPPSKPQQLQLPSLLLRPPTLPTKPVHPFGSRPGPSSAGYSDRREERRDSTERGIVPKKKPPLAPKPRHLLADYCPIGNVTVIRKRDGPIKRFDDPKTTPQCVLCEDYPSSATAYAQHLQKHHKSNLRAEEIYLTCDCGLEVRTDWDRIHVGECNGREFSLHKLNEK